MRITTLIIGALVGGGLVACGDDAPASPTTPSTVSGEDAGGTQGNRGGTAADAGTTDAAPLPPTGLPLADVDAPALAIVTPREGIAIDERRVTVTGTLDDDVGVATATYAIGTGEATALPLGADGTFAFAFTPKPGNVAITITARDAAGNETKSTRNAYFGHRMSCGNSQSALLSGGKLYTWGRNELGQLATGALVGTYSTTTTLPAMYEQPAASLVSVVTRQTFMIALANDGTVQTWGANDSGQLGYATLASCGTALTSACGRVRGTVPGITDAVAIAAGFSHALVLRADGTVLAFGKNDRGQLGQDANAVSSTTTPTAVPGLADVISLGAGSSYSAAVTAEGKVFVWGDNTYGQLGLGAADTLAHPVPAEIAGIDDAVSVASANYTVYVKRADGTVLAWGQNANGQVGNGTTTTVLAPTPVLLTAATEGVAAVPLRNVESIAGDGFVGLALDHAGKAYAWGLGSLGQLGQGYTADGARDLVNRTVASPVFVEEADRPAFDGVEIEGGAGGPSFVWTSQQKLFGWGWSFQGSLGGGSTLLNAWAYSAPRLVFPLPQP